MYCGVSCYISGVIINKIFLQICFETQAIRIIINHILDSMDTSNVVMSCQTNVKNDTSIFYILSRIWCVNVYAVSCHACISWLHQCNIGHIRFIFWGNQSKTGLLNWVWPKSYDIGHVFIGIGISEMAEAAKHEREL